MATYTRILLSGSTSGKVIPVVATTTPGTPLHTAIAGATAFDEVFLWASNTSNAPVALTIEWGGTGVGNELVASFSLPPNSPPIPIATGQVMNGGSVIAAFASVASVVNISGFVNRIQ